MPDKYVSKVILGNQTIIDLTSDTVVANKLLTGFTAHGADGAPITLRGLNGNNYRSNIYSRSFRWHHYYRW